MAPSLALRNLTLAANHVVNRIPLVTKPLTRPRTFTIHRQISSSCPRRQTSLPRDLQIGTNQQRHRYSHTLLRRLKQTSRPPTNVLVGISIGAAAMWAAWKSLQSRKPTNFSSPSSSEYEKVREPTATTSSSAAGTVEMIPYGVVMHDNTTDDEMVNLVREIEARITGSTKGHIQSSTNGPSQSTEIPLLKSFRINIPKSDGHLVDLLRKHEQVRMVSDESKPVFEYSKVHKTKSEKCDPYRDAWHLGLYPQLHSQSRTPVFIVDSKIALQHPEFEDHQDDELARNGSLLDHQTQLSSIPAGGTTHGTFVASMIGGKSLGLMPGYKLISAPFEDLRPQELLHVLRSIRIFLDANPTDGKCKAIVNMSFSAAKIDLDDMKSLQKEIDKLRERSVLLVAAAGNDEDRAAHHFDFPGRINCILTVGSIDQDEKESTFSSCGHRIDVFAPGEVCGASGEEYRWNTGTSFASPIVCGLALQYLSTYPDLDAEELRHKMMKHARYEVVQLREPNNPAHASPLVASPPQTSSWKTWWGKSIWMRAQDGDADSSTEAELYGET